MMRHFLLLVGALFVFGVLGSAMFTEPTVAKIEEVVGLIHRERL